MIVNNLRCVEKRLCQINAIRWKIRVIWNAKQQISDAIDIWPLEGNIWQNWTQQLYVNQSSIKDKLLQLADSSSRKNF